MKKNLELAAKLNFFRVPTQTILTNSSAQTLIVHYNPNFGKQFINPSELDVGFLADMSSESATSTLPSLNMVVDFVKSFHYISQIVQLQ